MDIQTIAMYDGSVASTYADMGRSMLEPLLVVLQSISGPGTDAFHIVRNLLGCLGYYIAAPGTTRNGTVGMKSYGPCIQPKPISLEMLSAKTFQ